MEELQQALSVTPAGRVAARASAAPRGAVDEGGKLGMSEEGERQGTASASAPTSPTRRRRPRASPKMASGPSKRGGPCAAKI